MSKLPPLTTEAEKRGMAVLREILSTSEYRRLHRDGFLIITGQNGKRFKIMPRSTRVFEELSPEQRSSWSVHTVYRWQVRNIWTPPHYNMPWPDALANQILFVQGHSKYFERFACRGRPMQHVKGE